MANRLLARLAIGVAVIAGAFYPDVGSLSAYTPSRRGGDSAAYSVARYSRFPIRWRLGKIDPRFNLDADQVKSASERAIHVWEAEAGKRLFVYDERGGFPVDLVFDARQETLNARRDSESRLDTTRLALDQLGRNQRDAMDRFNRAQARIDAETEAYDSKLNAYNSRVDYWNASGGAPPDIAAQLDSDKETLVSERSGLRRARQESEGMLSDANSFVVAYNDLSARYNQSVELFNQRFGSPITEEIGECLMSGNKPKSISIHAFQDSNHLARELAHEFGHSLGLKHVKGDGSLMSAVETGEVTADLRLTEQDRAELRRALAK